MGIESDVHWGYDLGFDPWPKTWERLGAPASARVLQPIEVRVAAAEEVHFGRFGPTGVCITPWEYTWVLTPCRHMSG